MTNQSGKSYFAFLMSKTFGPVLAIELVAQDDGSLKFVKRLDSIGVEGVKLDRKFNKLIVNLDGEPTNLCHGRDVKIISDSGEMTPETTVNGFVHPIVFKCLTLKTDIRPAKKIELQDVDCLFIFNPDDLEIKGTVERHVAASTPFYHGECYRNAQHLSNKMDIYIGLLTQAMKELEELSTDPNAIVEKTNISVFVDDDSIGFNYRGQTSKIGVDQIRKLIFTMMFQIHTQIMAYETAKERKAALLKELDLLNSFIDEQNP